jgi:hypothetical protein
MKVLETTFYRYVGYVAQGRPAQKHRIFGLLKPREYTLQATAMLRCILDKSADHMPPEPEPSRLVKRLF